MAGDAEAFAELKKLTERLPRQSNRTRSFKRINL
jgi:hypothetical protein